ncbi:MAG: hypothetical protein U1C46_02575 [Bacteroidales bacterium]|nr:hypothetical protein [Bacteroidales bacterium]
MKKIACFSFCLFACLLFVLMPAKASAQSRLPNAVYLKNGSVIKGKIIINDGLQGIRIENDCGSWVYKPNEFDSISYRRFKKISMDYQFKKKGYYNFSYLGILLGSTGIPIPTLTTINGYHLNQHVFAGIAVGYENYDFGVMPLFADLRYFFLEQKVAPFVALQSGYGFAMENIRNDNWGWASGYENETFGGFLFGMSTGVSFRISDHSAFKLSLGYRYQKLSYLERRLQGSDYLRRVFTEYNRIGFTLGFMFL